ncbi:branched-chain amino acid ABC transporter, ATP binding protein [Aeropyrum pernix K1]|uniref:Probable branched-chain amino acid transport ATP-binding protein LivG n=1 Tax=Aeropyrum pernix (strain ATCC 700893 / DSM 11879 / JCM 9820 / NBRC 100138 / K1) TaxID=272557 RepID=Q9YDJ4_AERPE|nr:ABC transporter ATP-binding protein [Aeropyrum pernix]BAA79903.1 branched-chain amino acid ABC transporter, ATP binding protein [Aeropyrum pernix K1]
MAGDIILRVEDLEKRFGGIVALDKVNLEIERGKVTLLIGPNGSGKTTLVNVISGFYKPDGGRVLFKGRDITGMSPHEISKLGLVRTFQIPKPFTNLTVLENVLTAADSPGENVYLAGLARRLWLGFEKRAAARAFEILGWVGLDHMWDRRSGELSGGQMKLLEIARAIMKGAEMIIMDEPAAGVNPRLAGSIMERIKYLAREKGITFLIIEHRIGLVKEYVDRVYAMSMGKVIASGKPDEVLNNPVVLESYLGG